MPSLRSVLVSAATGVALAHPAPAFARQEAGGCPVVTRVRFLPRPGQADRMKNGVFTGSNESETNDFREIARIKEAPKDGEWGEATVAKPVPYRFVKFESPNGGWGNVAEVEFYSGDRKLTGTVFGTNGSRDDAGNTFAKAMDGDPKTFFDGVSPNSQYVGIDLGPKVQAAAPAFTPKPGPYPGAQTVAISSATPGAKIRYVVNQGGAPGRDSGTEYKGPITLDKPAVVVAVAYTDTLAASPAVVAPFRIGSAAVGKALRTFHIGNSLTDTVDGWLKPVAESAGRELDFHRFTIPGAPTDWLWDHPGAGFGDSRYKEAFFTLAPLDAVVTQPFAGHDRSVENEAEYSGRFFDLARKDSPKAKLYLYVQWPGKGFQDNWSQAKGSTKALSLKPAATWQEGAANHAAYTEAVREKVAAARPGATVLVIPGGQALARLKTEMEAGRVPGLTDFNDLFSDDLHLSPKGRYLISLVHYACLYGESPEGKAGPLTTGLTPEQAKAFQKIAWETAKGYRWSGVR